MQSVACVKDMGLLVDHFYKQAINNDNEPTWFDTKDESLIIAFKHLVLQGHVSYVGNLMVKITKRGIAAKLFGFGNEAEIERYL
jgi:hypothetical protein